MLCGGLVALLAIAAGAVAAAPPPAPPVTDAPAAQRDFFERQVRPLLAAECYACHGDQVRQGGLRLDTRAGLFAGGEKGLSVVPGKPEESLLVKAVRHEGLQMPPGRKLDNRQIAVLERWVADGAWYPADAAVAAVPQTWEQAVAERRQWWSLQPVRALAPPRVKNPNWSSGPIDRFVQAKLEAEGLEPPASADRRTLIRRLYLVLTGLPPSPEKIQAFVGDPRPDAHERLVDELLASPHFGERWARHWMDVVRYGETYGYEWNYLVRDAWRYRDYLIKAFNQDVPYDQFLKEHIAGDLLPKPRIDPAAGTNESVVGTAFYRFGEAGHDVFREIGLDVLDNQIDTLSKAFQATTISCARCHDHKLDAVSTKDYYALLGVVSSSRPVVHNIDLPAQTESQRTRLKTLREKIRLEIEGVWSADAAEIARYVAAAGAEGPQEGLDAARVEAWRKMFKAKDGGLEDPLHLLRALKAAPDPAAKWNELAEQYRREEAVRREFNEKNFRPFGDFRDGSLDGWRAAGSGLLDGFVRSGTISVEPEGDRVIRAVLPAGISSAALSDRLNGELQSPDTLADTKQISVLAMGGKGAAIRLVPDHRHLGDAGRELKPEQGLHWVSLGRSDRDERVYAEVVTRINNQRFPERATKKKPGAADETRSWFAVSRAVINTGGESPRAELGHLLPLFEGDAAAAPDAAAQRYQELIAGTIRNWAAGKSTDGDIQLLNWLIANGLLANSASRPALAELLKEYRQVESTIPAPQVVAGLADQGPGYDHPVFIRGDFRTPGDPAPRQYLEVLCGQEDPFEAGGSGRLGLAEDLVSPHNPLTARVMVNRVWHWLFGTGLVRTVDDFGHMGERPSHPELLDHLATTFVKDGWSVKKLIRSIVSSRTFQATPVARDAAVEADPENRLLHHYPARRAEAEVVRDSILAVSGRLDPELYGPSIHPYRPQEKADRKLFAGPLDGEGRRSVYIEITLMEGAPFLTAFNQPEGKVAQGKRDITNVPAQALALLNDPFVQQQAQVWVDRLMKDGPASAGARVEQMYVTALGRTPAPSERQQMLDAYDRLAKLHGVSSEEAVYHRELWRDMAHLVFNLQEFVYIR